jgi:HSP20 family protein
MAVTTQKPEKKGEMLFEDPFATFGAMRRAMMRALLEPGFVPEPIMESAPALDLYEKDGTYRIDCALPGYKKDDIRVEASGDAITIAGSYDREKSEEKANYHRREVRRGSFSRTVALPQEIDPNSITANFEDGMLKLTMQPTKAIKSKTIAISG